MSEYRAEIRWQRGGQVFTDDRYSRAHVWGFDGGITVPASSSPYIVPPPQSLEAAVDPEEAFIASLSSCHMLWFLSIASKRGFTVDSYRDEAIGVMSRNADKRLAMTCVTLRPEVVFAGERLPTPAEIDKMHHAAHDQCFIANSVKTEVRCEPR